MSTEETMVWLGLGLLAVLGVLVGTFTEENTDEDDE